MRTLTEHGNVTRFRILRYIADHWAEHGYAPEVRDIASAISRSLPAAYHHLCILRDSGLLIWQPKTARTYRLTDTGRGYIAQDGGVS